MRIHNAASVSSNETVMVSLVETALPTPGATPTPSMAPYSTGCSCWGERPCHAGTANAITGRANDPVIAPSHSQRTGRR